MEPEERELQVSARKDVNTPMDNFHVREKHEIHEASVQTYINTAGLSVISSRIELYEQVFTETHTSKSQFFLGFDAFAALAHA